MNATLYLLQSSAASTPAALEKLAMIYMPDDCIVFFADALSMLNEKNFALFQKGYYMQSEHALVPDQVVASKLLALDYSTFADLVLQFERCISLK